MSHHDALKKAHNARAARLAANCRAADCVLGPDPTPVRSPPAHDSQPPSGAPGQGESFTDWAPSDPQCGPGAEPI